MYSHYADWLHAFIEFCHVFPQPETEETDGVFTSKMTPQSEPRHSLSSE